MSDPKKVQRREFPRIRTLADVQRELQAHQDGDDDLHNDHFADIHEIKSDLKMALLGIAAACALALLNVLLSAHGVQAH